MQVSLRDILLFIALTLAIINNFQVSSDFGVSSVQHEETGIGKRAVQLVTTPAIEEDLVQAKGMIQALAQVIMKLQSSLEQRVRFEGNSGITEARGYSAGTQPYHSSTHNTLNIHDHADTVDTMGMGEFAAILNGVEFTTRHNDYLLARPVQAGGTSNYHRTEAIPHPPVPPSVLNQPNITAQIFEMREYFRAFQAQDIKIRDYRPYFKANMCYLEGTWIQSTTNIDEPFRSDRHAIDAATWKVLNEKYRFLMNNGQKNNLENLAWLPTSLRDLVDREQFDVTHRTTTTTFTSDKSNPRPLSGSWAKPANPQNEVVIALSSRVEGVYLTLRSDFGIAGSFQSNVSCVNKSDGCAFITRPTCSSGSTCTWSTTNLNGTQNMVWADGALASVTYGPLTACFDLSVSIGNLVGATRAIFVTGVNKNITITQSPIRITGCIFNSEPVIANWEYRILCHPIEGDLPTNRFRPFEDNAAFLRDKKNATTMRASRRCLFELNPVNRSTFSDSTTTYEFIDDIMQAIPGKDNYGANLTDESFGTTTLHYKLNTRLNVGYYSRYFALSENDAMGRSQRRRGFNDPTLWAAMTTQDKVVGLSVYDDVTLTQRHQKWSYAIPIEVVYMTPLSTWNPYNLGYWPKNATSAQINTITQNGRDGSTTDPAKAYNRTSHKHFFRTPVEFFSGKLGETDPADTSSAQAKGVLDENGQLRVVMASGHYIIMPDIAGVGAVRQRYPVFPLSETKDYSYKEIRAWEHTSPGLRRGTSVQEESVTLWTSFSKGTVGLHQHELELGPFEISQLDAGLSVVVDSDLAAGHTHQIKVTRKKVGDNYLYTMIECDSVLPCWDYHDRVCTSPECVNDLPDVPVPVPVPVPPVSPPTSAPSSPPSVRPPTDSPVDAPVDGGTPNPNPSPNPNSTTPEEPQSQEPEPLISTGGIVGLTLGAIIMAALLAVAIAMFFIQAAGAAAGSAGSSALVWDNGAYELA